MTDYAADNPMGTDGFEFVEYTAPDPTLLKELFQRLGFRAVARHRSKNVELYRQGGINFIVNSEPDSFARAFARIHGPSICAMAFRVANAADAYARALELGARPVQSRIGPMEPNIPAIEGIGGSLLYLVDRYEGPTIYDVDFVPINGVEPENSGVGLLEIDHLTHNVHRGRMDQWAEFYERLFGFREIRFFDIKGAHTGLKSRAMTSPCGKIRIPINESVDNKSQIAEYLDAYGGEGIQHVALSCDDIYAAVETLRETGVDFLTTPETYFEAIESRVPGHGEDLDRLARNMILVDGAPQDGKGFCCRYSRKMSSGRFSSSSSNARAMTASVKVISKRCSIPSKRTKSGVAC